MAKEAPPFASTVGLGVAAGTTSGVGFMLRKHFANHFGVQGGGLIFAGSERRWWNLGLSGMYSIYRGKVARFYTMAGISLHTLHTNSSGASSKGSSEFLLLFGPGVGVELHAGKHFGWYFEVPVTMWVNVQRSSLPLGGKFNVLPVPNSGFTFYF